jgi:dTDP-4-dehydrorhamnose 3,5-epimerase
VGSPTNGATLTLDLGRRNDATHDHRGVFIPPGIAHGFAALTDMTITYLVDGYHNPTDELGVAWNDPDIDVDWGIDNPVVSTRDTKNPRHVDLEAALRPHFGLRI